MVTKLGTPGDFESFGRVSDNAGDFGGGGFSQKQLLFTHVHKFWRHKWIIVGALLLGLLYGTYEALTQTPLYRATLSMLIDPEDTISVLKDEAAEPAEAEVTEPRPADPRQSAPDESSELVGGDKAVRDRMRNSLISVFVDPLEQE